MPDAMHIVLASDNNYAQHATVAMASALRNAKDPARLHFFVIDDEIDAENKTKMQQSVRQLGGRLAFAVGNSDALANAFISGSLSRAAYFRLDLANILPAEVEKAIYLDCDLLVLQDIAELWDFDLHGRPLAAAEDFGILASSGKCAEKKAHLAWQREYSYFNSGVLLLDVKCWREENFSAQLMELALARAFRHHDQDALNFFFMKNWKRLPLKWNVIPPVFNMPLRTVFDSELRAKALAALGDMAIMHYAGGYKPWEYARRDGFNEKYYEYLALTEYRDAAMPQPHPKKRGHSLARQLLRLEWAELVRKIFAGN